MKKIVILSLLIISAILFAAEIRRGFMAGLLLIDAIRPPEQAVMGKMFSAPAVEEISVSSRDKQISATLYVPRRTGPFPPLLLAHDAAAAGRRDEQVASLAVNLARAGFLVLVPDLEALRSFRLRLSDAEDLVRSFQILKHRDQARSGGCALGMGFGAGPLIIAAADTRINGQIGTIAAFGGYGDLRAVLQFGLTGSYEYGGRTGRLRPDHSVRWTLAYRNLDLLAPAERETMQRVMEKQFHLETGEASRLAGGLGPGSGAVYRFLRNTDPDRFSPLYENLSTPFREYVRLLSPARVIKTLKADFILAHPMDDYAIPYTESLRLADAVGDPGRVRVALLPRFMQGETTGPGDWYQRYMIGGWRLFRAIYDLLEKNRL